MIGYIRTRPRVAVVEMGISTQTKRLSSATLFILPVFRKQVNVRSMVWIPAMRF